MFEQIYYCVDRHSWDNELVKMEMELQADPVAHVGTPYNGPCMAGDLLWSTIPPIASSAWCALDGEREYILRSWLNYIDLSFRLKRNWVELHPQTLELCHASHLGSRLRSRLNSFDSILFVNHLPHRGILSQSSLGSSLDQCQERRWNVCVCVSENGDTQN